MHVPENIDPFTPNSSHSMLPAHCADVDNFDYLNDFVVYLLCY